MTSGALLFDFPLPEENDCYRLKWIVPHRGASFLIVRTTIGLVLIGSKTLSVFFKEDSSLFFFFFLFFFFIQFDIVMPLTKREKHTGGTYTQA